MPQRRRHAHQTPMVPPGFGVTHARLGHAQRRLSILRNGLHGPAWPRQRQDPWRLPVHPLGHPHDRRARQRRAGATHHQPHLAQSGPPHRQGKRPRGLVPPGHRPVRRGGEERDEGVHGQLGRLQAQGGPRRVLEGEAGRLQGAVLLQPAAPVFFPGAGPGHPLFRERPTGKQEDAPRDCVGHRGGPERAAESALGTQRLGQRLHCGGCQPAGSHGLRAARPVLVLCRHDTVGAVCRDERFPAGALCLASRQPEGAGKAYRPTERMAGHRLVGPWRGGVAVVVLAVHVGTEMAPRLAQGGSADEGCVGLRPAAPFRLLEARRDATLVDLLLQPGRCREEAGEGRFVSALQPTAGEGGQAVVVQDDQARQIMLDMVKLAPILEEVPEDVRRSSHQGSGSHDWKLHQALTLSREGV